MKTFILAVILILGINLTAEAKPIVYAFTDDKCVPCQQMKPVWKQLERKGYKVYYYKSEKMRDKYDVSVLPTTIVMDNGKEEKRFEGVVSLRVIVKVLKTLASVVLMIIGL